MDFTPILETIYKFIDAERLKSNNCEPILGTVVSDHKGESIYEVQAGTQIFSARSLSNEVLTIGDSVYILFANINQPNTIKYILGKSGSSITPLLNKIKQYLSNPAWTRTTSINYAVKVKDLDPDKNGGIINGSKVFPEYFKLTNEVKEIEINGEKKNFSLAQEFVNYVQDKGAFELSFRFGLNSEGFSKENNYFKIEIKVSFSDYTTETYLIEPKDFFGAINDKAVLQKKCITINPEKKSLFTGIEDITFFCENFNGSFLIEDLQLYVVEAVNEDTTISFKIDFSENEKNTTFLVGEREKIIVKAQVFSGNTPVQDQDFSYLWFIKDTRIGSNSDNGYDWRGGSGWRCLNNPVKYTDEAGAEISFADPLVSPYFEIKINKDNFDMAPVKNNIYKCIVFYKGEVLKTSNELSIKNLSFEDFYAVLRKKDLEDDKKVFNDDIEFEIEIDADDKNKYSVSYQWYLNSKEIQYQSPTETYDSQKEYYQLINNLNFSKVEKSTSENLKDYCIKLEDNSSTFRLGSSICSKLKTQLLEISCFIIVRDAVKENILYQTICSAYENNTFSDKESVKILVEKEFIYYNSSSQKTPTFSNESEIKSYDNGYLVEENVWSKTKPAQTLQKYLFCCQREVIWEEKDGKKIWAYYKPVEKGEYIGINISLYIKNEINGIFSDFSISDKAPDESGIIRDENQYIFNAEGNLFKNPSDWVGPECLSVYGEEGAPAEEVTMFNKLTQNGTTDGIYWDESGADLYVPATDEDSGPFYIFDTKNREYIKVNDNIYQDGYYKKSNKKQRLFINASFLKAGTISIGSENNEIFHASIHNKEVTIGGFQVSSTGIFTQGKNSIENNYLQGIYLGNNGIRWDAENSNLVVDVNTELETWHDNFINKDIFVAKTNAFDLNEEYISFKKFAYKENGYELPMEEINFSFYANTNSSNYFQLNSNKELRPSYYYDEEKDIYIHLFDQEKIIVDGIDVYEITLPEGAYIQYEDNIEVNGVNYSDLVSIIYSGDIEFNIVDKDNLKEITYNNIEETSSELYDTISDAYFPKYYYQTKINEKTIYLPFIIYKEEGKIPVSSGWLNWIKDTGKTLECLFYNDIELEYLPYSYANASFNLYLKTFIYIENKYIQLSDTSLGKILCGTTPSNYLFNKFNFENDAINYQNKYFQLYIEDSEIIVSEEETENQTISFYDPILFAKKDSYFQLDKTKLEIKTPNFRIDPYGNVFVNGSGTFSGDIYANNGRFRGTVYATDGVFNGTVNATALNIEGGFGGVNLLKGTLDFTVNSTKAADSNDKIAYFFERNDKYGYRIPMNMSETLEKDQFYTFSINIGTIASNVKDPRFQIICYSSTDYTNTIFESDIVKFNGTNRYATTLLCLYSDTRHNLNIGFILYDGEQNVTSNDYYPTLSKFQLEKGIVATDWKANAEESSIQTIFQVNDEGIFLQTGALLWLNTADGNGTPVGKLKITTDTMTIDSEVKIYKIGTTTFWNGSGSNLLKITDPDGGDENILFNVYGSSSPGICVANIYSLNPKNSFGVRQQVFSFGKYDVMVPVSEEKISVEVFYDEDNEEYYIDSTSASNKTNYSIPYYRVDNTYYDLESLSFTSAVERKYLPGWKPGKEVIFYEYKDINTGNYIPFSDNNSIVLGSSEVLVSAYQYKTFLMDIGSNLETVITFGRTNDRHPVIFGTYSCPVEQIFVKEIITQTATSSDIRVKNTILSLSYQYETLFDNLRPVSFKYNNGTSGRTHTGFIAQEVIDAAEKAGISKDDLAMFCDVDGIFHLRYDEFVALNTSEIQKLKIRVKELEEKIKILTMGGITLT